MTCELKKEQELNQKNQRIERKKALSDGQISEK